MPEKNVRPLNLPKRTKAYAASVAKIVAKVALMSATLSERKKPSTRRGSLAKAVYQRVEKPVNTASCRVLLKEKTTKKSKGAYRKAKTAHNQNLLTR
jgi:hypothetical protein